MICASDCVVEIEKTVLCKVGINSNAAKAAFIVIVHIQYKEGIRKQLSVCNNEDLSVFFCDKYASIGCQCHCRRVEVLGNKDFRKTWRKTGRVVNSGKETEKAEKRNEVWQF